MSVAAAASKLRCDTAAGQRRFSAYASYQLSGVGWLPNIPSGWTIKRLRYALTLPTKSEIRGLPSGRVVSFVPMEAVGEHGGLSLEQTKVIEDVLNGYTYFRDGDVVVAKITPCFENGKGALAEGLEGGIGFGTTELHVLRAGPELDRRYLFYLTLGEDFRRLGTAEMYGAGGQKRVPESFIRELRHPIPPLDEQRVIAAFLDRETARIDTLIAKKQRLIELLQEKRTALTSHAVTKGLDPNATMKSSGIGWLGEIPEHWKVLSVRRIICRIEQGWSPDADNRSANDDEWAVMRAGCVNSGQFNETDHKALPTGIEPPPNLEIRPGDLLMSRACGSADLVGSVAIVRRCRPRLILCDKLFRLHARRELADQDFLSIALSSRFVRFQLEGQLSGAEGLARNISQASIRDLCLCLPPRDEQSQIVVALRHSCDRLNRLSETVQAGVVRLREYRSALISAAVTGKIDVRARLKL